MTTYERSEIIASGKAVKKFGAILSDIKSGHLKKALISRNNVLEAVILPVEEYERLEESAEVLEHISIAKIIARREKEKTDISLEEMLKAEGINLNEL
ncbi:MAG: hypothetical protein U9R02_04105 [Thermodesulfobacteriota bacterium]|nr:hypothetical protein [Thermodesulfobacteriota bacterium]